MLAADKPFLIWHGYHNDINLFDLIDQYRESIYIQRITYFCFSLLTSYTYLTFDIIKIHIRLFTI